MGKRPQLWNQFSEYGPRVQRRQEGDLQVATSHEKPLPKLDGWIKSYLI